VRASRIEPADSFLREIAPSIPVEWTATRKQILCHPFEESRQARCQRFLVERLIRSFVEEIEYCTVRWPGLTSMTTLSPQPP